MTAYVKTNDEHNLRAAKETHKNLDKEDQGLASLNCADHRCIFSPHGFPTSGVKYDIIARVATFIQGLSSIDDSTIENFEDENEDGLKP